MQPLSPKTLEILLDLINEKPIYRSGPKLIEFFNSLGFKHEYRRGFHRGTFTKECLEVINGRPEMDQCLKNLFDPILYVENYTDLIDAIDRLNKYLVFDGWKVRLEQRNVKIYRASLDIDSELSKASEQSETSEDSFLSKNYVIDFDNVPLDEQLKPVIKMRLDEIDICMQNSAPLGSLFLCGSTLEGVLLGIAIRYPRHFNIAKSAPHNGDKIKPFQEWKLNDLIEVGYELSLLHKDVRDFSKVLRDFRNYIHPYEQLSNRFNPDRHTAEICFQVLKAAICQIGDNHTLLN